MMARTAVVQALSDGKVGPESAYDGSPNATRSSGEYIKRPRPGDRLGRGNQQFGAVLGLEVPHCASKPFTPVDANEGRISQAQKLGTACRVAAGLVHSAPCTEPFCCAMWCDSHSGMSASMLAPC
jgi:hypothetical protein